VAKGRTRDSVSLNLTRREGVAGKLGGRLTGVGNRPRLRCASWAEGQLYSRAGPAHMGDLETYDVLTAQG
jgi:hypothetical protein